MIEDRVVDGIRVPGDLTNPRAVAEYVKIIKEFAEENARAPKGVMGSYCEAGQQHYAYEMAMVVQKPIKFGKLELPLKAR